MQSPFTIKFPYQTSASANTDFTPDRTGVITSFADIRRFMSADSTIISQSVNGDDYWIEMLSISVEKDNWLYLEIDEAFFCIAAMVDGAFPKQTTRLALIDLPEYSYNMYCLPSGAHQVHFPVGKLTIVFLLPHISQVKRMAREQSALNYLLELTQQQSEYGASLETFPYPDRVREIIQEMKASTLKGAALDLLLRRHMLEIISLYNYQLNTLNLPEDVNTARAFKVRDYILKHIEDPQLGGLSDLASRFHVTPKTLTRDFRMLFQRTVPELIKHERLERAYQLLSGTHRSVQEVAEKTGYYYQAHFTRDFKTRYGITPSALKQKKLVSDIGKIMSKTGK